MSAGSKPEEEGGVGAGREEREELNEEGGIE